MPTTTRFPRRPVHLFTFVATSLVLGACAVDRSEPFAPDAVAFKGGLASVTSSITLGSGMIGTPGQRDAANQLIACNGPACPSGALPQGAYINWQHNAYAAPLSGTRYIAQVADGTTKPAPGYDCCTKAVFENTFPIPSGASSATISIRVLADNQAIVAVNGVEFGRQSPDVYANFAGPASSFTTSFTPDPSGTNTLQVTLVDGGGALGLDYLATVTYVTDNTPPVVTWQVTGTEGNNGWYTSDVGISWTVTDSQSTVSSMSGCSTSTLASDSNGSTYTCTATSAGGTARDTVTVKRDATDPVVAFAGNASTYTVDQQVSITCSASDATSGIASSSCLEASGAAYSFGVGSHTLSAAAEDNAGNTASMSAQFNVQVTSGSLCTLVKQWVNQRGIANAMCKQLQNGAYGAFRNHVGAQSGKSVTAANAGILIALSNSL